MRTSAVARVVFALVVFSGCASVPRGARDDCSALAQKAAANVVAKVKEKHGEEISEKEAGKLAGVAYAICLCEKYNECPRQRTESERMAIESLTRPFPWPTSMPTRSPLMRTTPTVSKR